MDLTEILRRIVDIDNRVATVIKVLDQHLADGRGFPASHTDATHQKRGELQKLRTALVDCHTGIVAAFSDRVRHPSIGVGALDRVVAFSK
jgi:hypothetical protein